MWVVVPYIIPLLGAIGVAFVMLRWVKARKQSPEQSSADTDMENISAETDEYKRKLEEELEDFE